MILPPSSVLVHLRQAARAAGVWVIVAAVALVVGFVAIVSLVIESQPRPSACGERTQDIARANVKQMAFEAYPQWAARPGNAGRCPTAADLGIYMATANPRDPWGEAYVITCTDLPAGTVGIAVSSNGEDRRAGTGDDVRSWE